MKIHTKRRKANNNEPWIGELLDEVSEDKLLEMSAITSALSCAHLLRCIWVAYSTMFCWITTIIG